jgi:alkyldihydroxyacetonephosphate synthase
MTSRTPLPAALDATAAGQPTRFLGAVEVPPDLIGRLGDVCETVDVSDGARVEAGRDWWPLSTVWAVKGSAPALPAVVVRPADAIQVAAVLALCNDATIPVTAFAGASGVCGGSIPLYGGVSMDLVGLDGIAGVDDDSLLIDVRSGMFGDEFEDELQRVHGLTVGHWPQSVALSTVGGWAACRGAGQYSTRYGKIEDLVVGLEVALADGTLIRTGGHAPRAAAGPDLTQLFVGSEGTLGVITEVRLRARPRPPAEERAVYGFRDFAAGLDACRRILRRGATPAVLRLYDHVESARSFEVEERAVLIVVDEGDADLIRAVMAAVHAECTATDDVTALDTAVAGRWLEHRNQIPALESLVRGGIVADTVEISGSWAALPVIYKNAVEGLMALDGTLAASAHQSHAYTDGGCLYFTFAGQPGDPAKAEPYYNAAFETVMNATTRAGGALSHHHGIGLNRARFMPAYLGPAFETLAAVKDALDPRGILNPGKLGLSSPFGPDPYP